MAAHSNERNKKPHGRRPPCLICGSVPPPAWARNRRSYRLFAAGKRIHSYTIHEVCYPKDWAECLDRERRSVFFKKPIAEIQLLLARMGIAKTAGPAFYHSATWKKARAVTIAMFGGKCARCGVTTGLSVHHIDGNNRNGRITNRVCLCQEAAAKPGRTTACHQWVEANIQGPRAAVYFQKLISSSKFVPDLVRRAWGLGIADMTPPANPGQQYPKEVSSENESFE
jgi:hypothetical protein